MIARDSYLGTGTLVGTVDTPEVAKEFAVLVRLGRNVVDPAEGLGSTGELYPTPDIADAISQDGFSEELAATTAGS